MSDDTIKNVIGKEAIEQFLSSDHKGYLTLKNGELHFISTLRMGKIDRFKAALGLGRTSFRKVSLFIAENQDQLFPHPSSGENKKLEFNKYVTKFNKKQFIYWRRAVLIEEKVLQFKKDSPQDKIKKALDECQAAYERFKQEENSSIDKLLESCKTLTETLSHLDAKDPKGTQELLNAVLRLKNEMRSSLIEAKGKTLKGPPVDKRYLLKKADQALLKVELKNLRKTLLNKHFDLRLKEDRARVKLLKAHLEEKEKSGKYIQEKEFLTRQLKRWERKLDQGKPISIPKWYHMTTDAEKQKSILTSEIKYMKKGKKPGAFVGNYAVDEFGDFGIVLSSHIEKTSIHEGNKKRYPKYSFATDFKNTQYSHHIKIRKKGERQPRIWLGFRRGENALDDDRAKGIPLYQKQRVEETKNPLNYYDNTTLAYIYVKRQRPSIQKDIEQFAKEHRIQMITHTEAEALWQLIDETFQLTLPREWKGKIEKI